MWMDVLRFVGVLMLIAWFTLLLEGCSVEGAGFQNSGRPISKSCRRFDASGREYWERCS